MEGGRTWQRRSSKNARGNSNNRQLTQPNDGDTDTLMSTIQKSQIASILQGARSHVGQEVSRPFTPGDMPRHLFSGDDYANRPGSSYKMKNIIGQAMDEFNNAIANTTSSQNTTTSSGNIGGLKQHLRSGSQNKDQNIMNVLQKVDTSKKARNNILPALQPINKDVLKGMSGISRQQIKGFDSGKPIKVQQQQQQLSEQINTSTNLNSSSINEQQPELMVQGTTTATITQKKVIKLKKPSANGDEPKKIRTQKSVTQVDDYSDLMKQDQDSRMEEIQRFDQSKMDNLIKIQKIQQDIKKANRNKDDQDGEGEDEDQYEDYFENQMQLDMEGVESYQHEVDYSEALEKIKQQVSDIDQNKNKNEDDIDDEYLMAELQEESQMSGYLAEYYDVVNEMSKFCQIISNNTKQEQKEKKQHVSEEDVMDLCPRIYTLATEHEKQGLEIQQQCFLETLLKGSFSLLSVKYPRCVLRLSACNIHLFLKIFDKYIQNQNHGTQADFQKLYNYVFETMKILLLYAKEKKNDILFKQENLIPQLSRVIHQCFLERSDIIIKLTCQIVNKKEIVNEDLIYDLVNYIIGAIKCFTQSNLEVQTESIKQRYIMMLSKCMQKAMTFGTNMSKKAQNLVQVCGALRNLSNDDSSYEQICSNGMIPKLIDVLDNFKGHVELMVNVSRILSKVSMDNDCSYAIIKTKKLCFLVDLLYDYHKIRDFPVRISFVLANLTTYFEEAREQLGAYHKSLQKILQISIHYLEKSHLLFDQQQDEQQQQQIEQQNPDKNKREDPMMNFANVEDNLIKLIRLVANLSTDETYTQKQLKSQQEKLNLFMSHMIKSVGKRTLEKSEEFIFNAVSCSTNILFYDVPQSPLLTQELRVEMFHTLKGYLLITTNEELQIEAVRVLSNLSRHSELCLEFVNDKTFLEAICVVLEHTLRDLVFYTIGIVINITIHESTRPKIMDKGIVPKLIDVLKDANIEDMELAKVSAKALHNITGDNNYWTFDQIKKLDDILSNLGEELDSIMDVANEDEMEEIKSLRDMVNALINDMPEPMYDCSDVKCGRKFKNKDELDKHIERRHGGKQ